MEEQDPLGSDHLQRPEQVAPATTDESGEVESDPRFPDAPRGADACQFAPSDEPVDDDRWGDRRIVEGGPDPAQLEAVRIS
jgi:hypothetical protein